mmetsp:Transcript_27752/g.66076  ORF Transcript_27752/g.66076 Transcript_27752/m.66076 type:complete len:265 (-) Transcript_27752:721-1515(-)
MISTRTSLPRMVSMSPSNSTGRPCSILPFTCAGFLTLRSSTSTSITRPRYRWERSKAWRVARRITLCSLSAFTFSSSWLCHEAAGVFGRGEYAAVLVISNCTASISFMLFSNISSVSPGNPTMTSAVIAASGMSSLIRLMIFRYASTVWPLPMALRIVSSPDWKGRWIDLHSFGCLAIVSTTPSDMYLGWEVVKRMRSMPSTSERCSSRSENLFLGSMSLPHASMFCPRSVTSLKPAAASVSNSARMLSRGRDCSTPRVVGTTQ